MAGIYTFDDKRTRRPTERQPVSLEEMFDAPPPSSRYMRTGAPQAFQGTREAIEFNAEEEEEEIGEDETLFQTKQDVTDDEYEEEEDEATSEDVDFLATSQTKYATSGLRQRKIHNVEDTAENFIKYFMTQKRLRVVTTFIADIPRFNLLFFVTCFLAAWMFTLFMISYLVGIKVVGDGFNTYLFTIIGSLISLALVGLYLYGIYDYYNSYNFLTYKHYLYISITAGVCILALVFCFFSIGQWLWVYATCCDTADSQPFVGDIANYQTYYSAFFLLETLSFYSLGFIPFAIYAHLFPEAIATENDIILYQKELSELKKFEN